MKIYMAGGVSGNLKPFWKCVSAMVAQGVEYHEAFDRAMKIFLAGVDRDSHRQVFEYANLSRGSGLVAPIGAENIRGGV